MKRYITGILGVTSVLTGALFACSSSEFGEEESSKESEIRSVKGNIDASTEDASKKDASRGGTSSGASSGTAQICTPGAYVYCRCGDGREGTKLCDVDGWGFGACECE